MPTPYLELVLAPKTFTGHSPAVLVLSMATPWALCPRCMFDAKNFQRGEELKGRQSGQHKTKNKTPLTTASHQTLPKRSSPPSPSSRDARKVSRGRACVYPGRVIAIAQSVISAGCLHVVLVKDARLRLLPQPYYGGCCALCWLQEKTIRKPWGPTMVETFVRVSESNFQISDFRVLFRILHAVFGRRGEHFKLRERCTAIREHYYYYCVLYYCTVDSGRAALDLVGSTGGK